MLASIPKNQYPFAIGVMETSSADIAKHGLKGKGLKLLHHYPDMLWALGDKSVPDPSFTATRVFPEVTYELHPVMWQAFCRFTSCAYASIASSHTRYTVSTLDIVCSSCPPSQTPYCL